MVRILSIIQDICEKQTGKNFFPILKEIFDHLSKYEQEPEDQRAESIKAILDSQLENIE